MNLITKERKNIIKILIILILMLNLRNITYAKETNIDENKIDDYGINSFLEDSKIYIENDDDINLKEIFKQIISGKFDNSKFIKIIVKAFNKNIKYTIKEMLSILIIVIISSILKAISENLGNEETSKMAFFVEYILIVTILMKNFLVVTKEVKETISNLVTFSNSLIPLLFTLLVVSGNITTSSVLENILLIIVTFIGNFIINFLIPILMISQALSIVSKISDDINVSKLSDFFKKGTIWTLTTILALFITLASLESNLTSSIDVVTKKAGKSVISVAVPVVGSILGDAIDTISGYGNLLKNGVGIIGTIVILEITLKTIINLVCITITYYFSAALIDIVADKKTSQIIVEMASTYKILLAAILTIVTTLIIGLAIVMKVTST